MKKFTLIISCFINVLIISFIIYFYGESLVWLGRSWITNPYYQHGYMILAISLVLIALNFIKKGAGDFDKNWFILQLWRKAFPYLTISFVLYLLASWLKANFLMASSLVFFLRFWFIFLFGKNTVRSLNFPLFFLLLAIPFPYLPEIMAYLQIWNAKVSTGALKLLGFSSYSQGVAVFIGKAAFRIEEECTGMKSIISLITLMIFLVYLTTTKLLAKLIIGGLSLPVAFFSNLARIIVLLLIGNYWGEEKAMSYWHHWGGALFYLISLLLLFLIFLLLKKGEGER